jgi:hypothetical protein
MSLYPHRLLGHRWRFLGRRQCDGCLRWVEVWTCRPCGVTSERRVRRGRVPT